MMKALFTALALPLIPMAAHAEPKEQPKVLATVEASDEFRKSILVTTEIQIRETLPDPATSPESHKRFSELTRTHMMEGRIEGFAIFEFDRGWIESSLDYVRPTLTKPSNLAPLSEKGANKNFYPELILTWKTEDRTYRALISIRSGELVFAKDGEQLRYKMTDEGLDSFRELVDFTRNIRPDPIEDLHSFQKTLTKDDESLVVNDAPRRQPHGKESADEANPKRKTFEISGHTFFKADGVKRDFSAIRTMLREKTTFKEWGGTKACGGFHPDFAVSWGPEEKQTHILICLTCHEIYAIQGRTRLIYDIADEAYSQLKAELEKFRPVPGKH